MIKTFTIDKKNEQFLKLFCRVSTKSTGRSISESDVLNRAILLIASDFYGVPQEKLPNYFNEFAMFSINRRKKH